MVDLINQLKIGVASTGYPLHCLSLKVTCPGKPLERAVRLFLIYKESETRVKERKTSQEWSRGSLYVYIHTQMVFPTEAEELSVLGRSSGEVQFIFREIAEEMSCKFLCVHFREQRQSGCETRPFFLIVNFPETLTPKSTLSRFILPVGGHS